MESARHGWHNKVKKSKIAILLIAGVVLFSIGAGVGVVVERDYLKSGGDGGVMAASGNPGEPKVLYWVAPMDPKYRRDGPGKSPMGMDLVPVYEGEDKAGAESDEGVVKMSPAMVHNLGVRTASAERTTLQPSIETFGVVSYDETRTSHVHVRAEGWIERLNVRSIGETAKKGELLFEIFSPDLATAAWEYVREVQGQDEQMYAGARRKLLSLGVDPRQIDEIRRSRQVPDRIKVYAPRSGVAVALNVADGMFVTPEMTTVSITDPSVVWLIADVFESQAAFVRPGMKAEARIAGMPDRVWKGSIEYVYPDLRPETRTVQLRLRFDNPDLMLKPNMYASVSLVTEAKENVLAVPQGAVIRTGRANRVVKALGDGRFKAVPVKIGQAVGDRIEILEGINEGERVVVSAQFLIDSESSLIAGFRQMEDPETIGESEPAAAPTVTVTKGRIAAVDPARREATMTHEPIPSLGWPAMTMDFALDESLDASKLVAGNTVEFDFINAGPGVFAIVAVRPVAGETAEQPSVEAAASAAAEPEAWTVATVNGGGTQDGQVNVTHAPIPALGWPAMTMDLGVGPSVPPAVLAPGRRLRIGLAKGEDGLYRIVAAEAEGR